MPIYLQVSFRVLYYCSYFVHLFYYVFISWDYVLYLPSRSFSPVHSFQCHFFQFAPLQHTSKLLELFNIPISCVVFVLYFSLILQSFTSLVLCISVVSHFIQVPQPFQLYLFQYLHFFKFFICLQLLYFSFHQFRRFL